MCRGGRVDAGERATEIMELVTGVKGVAGGPQMERKEKRQVRAQFQCSPNGSNRKRQ